MIDRMPARGQQRVIVEFPDGERCVIRTPARSLYVVAEGIRRSFRHLAVEVHLSDGRAFRLDQIDGAENFEWTPLPAHLATI